MASPASPSLSGSQLETLARVGEERPAEVGDMLYKRRRPPLSADRDHRGRGRGSGAAGSEIIRHGPSGFLGETNLLSGQTVYLTAVVTNRCATSPSTARTSSCCCSRTGRSATCCCRRSLCRREGLQSARGLEWRSSGRTRPSDSTDGRFRPAQPSARQLAGHEHAEDAAAAAIKAAPRRRAAVGAAAGRAGPRNPSPGEVSRALGVGLLLVPARKSTSLSSAAGRPGWELRSTERPKASTRSSSREAGSAVRRVRPPDRELPRLPRRHHRLRAHGSAVTQARKFGARTATPYRALALEPGTSATLSGSRATRGQRPRRRARNGRRLPPATGRRSTPTKASASSTLPGRRRRSTAVPRG